MAWHQICTEEFEEDTNNLEPNEETDASVFDDVKPMVNTNGSPMKESSNLELSTSDLGINEPLAFLQGLNSGNLMQFSQQSVLNELMQLERTDIKPQINTLPTVEGHNDGGYDFLVILNEPPRSHWLYSEPLNKLFTRMNKMFDVTVQFKSKMPIQQLNLRAFLVFVKEVSAPVLRCQNHLSTDPVVDNLKKRESFIRCDHPETQYCGSATGKSIMDRFSILVPLNMCRATNGNIVRQTLSFEFVCQNSCFGRKESCLIFCLENTSGEILGQHILHVKICTCPKRDCTQEERQIYGIKRKHQLAAGEDEETNDSIKKLRLTNHLKDDNESSGSSELDCSILGEDCEISCTKDGRFRLVIECPSKELMLKNIEGMIEKTATEIFLCQHKNSRSLQQHAQKLLKLKKQALSLP